MTSIVSSSPRSALAAAACGVFLLAAAGCAATPPPVGTPGPASGSLSAARPLVDSLSTEVPGLPRAQAEVSAGALLSLAKAQMPTGQFAQVAAAIPGADALVSEAIQRGLPAGVTQMADVTSFLGRSGVSPSQVTRMVPVLTAAVEGKASPEAALGFFSVLSALSARR